MQKGALANQAVWIGRFAPQQQRGRVDRTAGEYDVLGSHTYGVALALKAVGTHHGDHEFRGLAAAKDDPFRARVIQQLGALIERSGQRGDEHRLLGIRGASHAAIAQIPAAVDVARNDLRGDAEFDETVGEQLVVAVWRNGPRRHVQSLFHPLPPRRQLFGGEILQTEV